MPKQAFNPPGSNLTDHDKRPGEEAADLVWGRRPLRREPEFLLSAAGGCENEENTPCGNGYEKTL